MPHGRPEVRLGTRKGFTWKPPLTFHVERYLRHGLVSRTFTAYQPMRRRPSQATVERLLVAMGCTWESMDLARALLREVAQEGAPAVPRFTPG